MSLELSKFSGTTPNKTGNMSKEKMFWLSAAFIAKASMNSPGEE